MNDLLQDLLSDEGWGDLSHWPMPLAYGLASLVCGWLGTYPDLTQHTPERMRQLWLLLCPLYLLAAASCLVQGDVLWLHWARSFARAHQLYEERRSFQIAALLGLVLLAWKVLQQPVPAQAEIHTTLLHGMLVAGGTGTLALFLLRYLSFHYTDLVLNTVWLHHSVASWLECACLGLAGAATGLELQENYGHV